VGVAERGRKIRRRKRGTGSPMAPKSSGGGGRTGRLRRAILSAWRHLSSGKRRGKERRGRGFYSRGFLEKGARVRRGTGQWTAQDTPVPRQDTSRRLKKI
jgi:hypothetical protein